MKVPIRTTTHHIHHPLDSTLTKFVSYEYAIPMLKSFEAASATVIIPKYTFQTSLACLLIISALAVSELHSCRFEAAAQSRLNKWVVEMYLFIKCN